MPLAETTLERIRLAYPPAEVAQLLGLSKAKVYELLARGAIPSVKIDNSRRILHDALVDYLHSLGPDR